MKTLKYHTFLIKYSKVNWDLKNPWFNLKHGEVLNKYTITLKNTVEYDIIQQLRTKNVDGTGKYPIEEENQN